jgi:hypothetical protein
MITQSDVDRVLADNPLITAEGFEHGWKKTRPEYVPASVNIREMQGAVDWLEKADRRVSVNTTCSSYGLKHIAEKTVDPIPYISNGAFTAAAYYLGFDVRRINGGPNAHINISNKSVRKLRAANLV